MATSWTEGDVKGHIFESLLSGRWMQRSVLPVVPLFLIHFASVFPEVFVALDIQLDEVADFDGVDFPCTTVADLRKWKAVVKRSVSTVATRWWKVTDLMHSFPEDIFVFIFVDVFSLIVRFDG